MKNNYAIVDNKDWQIEKKRHFNMFKVYQLIKIDFFSFEISTHDDGARSSKVFRTRLFVILSNSREVVSDLTKI
jgi:hypothetical protein